MTTTAKAQPMRASDSILKASPPALAAAPCFMETQFPVSKLSKESYTERKAVAGQTLTGLGKWWGRKPLVLCRATILGLLLPATDDPKKDRDVFLRLMTMDDDGMLRRRTAIPVKVLFSRLPPHERAKYFTPESSETAARFKKGVTREQKDEVQIRVFLSMSYDERLDYCDRPEQIDGPSPASWKVINSHLGTRAASLPELVGELGQLRFGHVPRVGDAFCGGGSIPFEAARIGCDAYGSDLNPVAALLTWAALNIVGGGPEVAKHVQEAQQKVFAAVDRQITEWGIEHREPDSETGRRWRADAYLYCTEATCPECKWRVPLAPSWLIAEKTSVVARLIPDKKQKRFEIAIASGVSDRDKKASAAGTVRDSELNCPNGCQPTKISSMRGDGRGTFGPAKSLLRPWDNHDVAPQPSDVFTERLYCIRWLDTWTETDDKGKELQYTERHYLSPTDEDLKREQQALSLLRERFDKWQSQALLPVRRIESGYNTDQPIRERGWTYWHHLFAPRQLLLIGLFASESQKCRDNAAIALLLLVGRLADWNSRLSVWLPTNGGGIGGGKNTFLNQAYNTLFNYSVRPSISIDSLALPERFATCSQARVDACDARSVTTTCDIWITDPPYADAVIYPELSEFYLAWYEGQLALRFPQWSPDSKRALAVRGDDDRFRAAMVDSYRNLAALMPPDGLQVVMFTHQDAGVWADLALILWAAGLRVTAAWCIATETNASYKDGNYVQGTVLMILRKRSVTEAAFLDEVYHDVEAEVRQQLDIMLALDDKEDPNFTDTDYQLAAYAAALRVLTSRKIEEIDVAHELAKVRAAGQKSTLENLIENAVRIACDHLIPRGIDAYLWKSLSALERFYLKGLEMESHGEHRQGVYQELARGFGLQEYALLLAGTRANETRLKTASECGRKDLGTDGFGATLVRHALFAAFKTTETDGTRDGMQWLRDEVDDYWGNRERLIGIFEFLAAFGRNASMPHWQKDAHSAALLAGAARNDHV